MKPHRTQVPSAVTRRTVRVTATLLWPAGQIDWWALDAVTREQIRGHLDAACDLIESRLP